MSFNEIIEKSLKYDISDIHITVGLPPVIRIHGELKAIKHQRMMVDDVKGIVDHLLNEEQFRILEKKGDIDIAYSRPRVGRFRINVFKQRGSLAIAARVVGLEIPEIDKLGLPDVIKEFTHLRRGLVLITGPTGSGKSTTLGAMINQMNKERQDHIITIEDPIEFLHKHGKCIINQREIGDDTSSFAGALRSALRQDPDIILVGEMRDLETISTAITAAETGHLVLSTVHTIGAANTIERLVDVFPAYQQEQIKVQLSSVLKGVVSQQILPTVSGKERVAAFEIMKSTSAVQNLIREGKPHQIQTIIQTQKQIGMQTMDGSLLKLYKQGKISKKIALRYAIDSKNMDKRINYI